jgi:hypothetical protein
MSVQNSDDNGDIPETHNYTKTVGTRLSPETKDRLDRYTDDHQVSKAEGARRLIRDGLDAQNESGWRDRAGRAFALLLLMGYPTVAAAGGALTVAAGWIVLVGIAVLFEPWISNAISRIPNPLDWL